MFKKQTVPDPKDHPLLVARGVRLSASAEPIEFAVGTGEIVGLAGLGRGMARRRSSRRCAAWHQPVSGHVELTGERMSVLLRVADFRQGSAAQGFGLPPPVTAVRLAWFRRSVGVRQLRHRRPARPCHGFGVVSGAVAWREKLRPFHAGELSMVYGSPERVDRYLVGRQPAKGPARALACTASHG